LFLPFDTSALPDSGITIDSASLTIYINTVGGEGSGSNFALVQTTQPSNTVLTTADYDLCGSLNSPDEGWTRQSFWSTGSKEVSLNGNGLGWISKTGYTKLGIRVGLDVDNEAAIDGSKEMYIIVRTSEYSDTTYDPLLKITYSVPPQTITAKANIWNTTVKTATSRGYIQSPNSLRRRIESASCNDAFDYELGFFMILVEILDKDIVKELIGEIVRQAIDLVIFSIILLVKP